MNAGLPVLTQSPVPQPDGSAEEAVCRRAKSGRHGNMSAGQLCLCQTSHLDSNVSFPSSNKPPDPTLSTNHKQAKHLPLAVLTAITLGSKDHTSSTVMSTAAHNTYPACWYPTLQQVGKLDRGTRGHPDHVLMTHIYGEWASGKSTWLPMAMAAMVNQDDQPPGIVIHACSERDWEGIVTSSPLSETKQSLTYRETRRLVDGALGLDGEDAERLKGPTLVIDLDLQCSAGLALLLVSVVSLTKKPRGRSFRRILTMSSTPAPECLLTLLGADIPGRQTLSQFYLASPDPVWRAAGFVSVTSEDLVETVKDGVVKEVSRRKTEEAVTLTRSETTPLVLRRPFPD